MDMIPVESSNIDAVGHDPATQTLAIRFKSGLVYHYAGVSAEAHKALVEAKSIGGHFAQFIRPSYVATKQEPTQEEEATRQRQPE